MARLTYGGISISFGTHTYEVTEPRDPSGTDALYRKVIIKVRGVLASGVAPANPGESPAAIEKRIEDDLMVPRRALLFQDGATTLVNIPTPPDMANGPFPLYAHVDQMLEGGYAIEYGVECHVTACDGNPSPQYLSLRWSETCSYDKDWLATKRRTGLLILPSNSREDPDDFRGGITPSLEPGFRRESAEYTLSPNNLEVSFTFIDRELMRSPPFPATTMQGRMLEQVSYPGALRHGVITLTLGAPKGVPQKELMNAAIKVALSRALATGIKKETIARKDRLPSSASFWESYDDDKNQVGIELRWMMQPARAREKGYQDRELRGGTPPPFYPSLGPPSGTTHREIVTSRRPDGKESAALNTYAGWVGLPIPGSDPKRGIGPPTRGTASFLRNVGALLGDPCIREVDLTGALQEFELRNSPERIVQFDSVYVGRTPSGAQLAVHVGQTAPPPDDLDALTGDDKTDGVYAQYVLQAHYVHDKGRAVVPSTKEGEPAAVVQFHNETKRLRVEWSARRYGGPPEVPSDDPPDSNTVSLKSTTSLEGMGLAPDGVSYGYGASGVLEFGFKDSTKIDPTAPISPWLSFVPASRERGRSFLKSPRILWDGVHELRGDPDGGPFGSDGRPKAEG